MPMIGTNGTQGVRKGRGCPGLERRKARMAMQTITNANNVPMFTILPILVGLLAAIVGSLTPIDDIGRMVNIGTLLAFVIVCIAILALRRSNPGQPRPFRTPWVPFVPIMGILFNGYMMYKLGWVNWARLIIWLVVYFTYSRKHSRVQAALEGRKTP